MPDAGGPRAEAGSNKADNDEADDNEADNNSTRKAERGGRNGKAVF